MDGYLAKPLRTSDVQRVIDALLPGGEAGHGAPVEGAGHRTPADEQVFDASAVLARVGGNAALLREIAGLFAEESARLLREIRQAAGAADAREVERVAHSFKGTFASLSAADGAAVAGRIETAAAAGNLGDVAAAPAELERQVERLGAALEREVLR
jgi:HPt (histidine-containing phosphotransfer) domain-containing protein